jgi:hypothetical protein
MGDSGVPICIVSGPERCYPNEKNRGPRGVRSGPIYGIPADCNGVADGSSSSSWLPKHATSATASLAGVR